MKKEKNSKCIFCKTAAVKIGNKDQRCPICNSKKDPRYPDCFHCSVCWFEACNCTGDRVSYILDPIKKRLEDFFLLVPEFLGNRRIRINKCIIQPASNSGGKAGKGCNKTSTLSIMTNNLVIKQIRFKTKDTESYVNACRKAIEYAKNLKVDI